MVRTLKKATVRRYHYALREHLDTFARRLKTLRGLTVFEYVKKCWTDQKIRSIKNQAHHFPGLNN